MSVASIEAQEDKKPKNVQKEENSKSYLCRGTRTELHFDGGKRMGTSNICNSWRRFEKVGPSKGSDVV